MRCAAATDATVATVPRDKLLSDMQEAYAAWSKAPPSQVRVRQCLCGREDRLLNHPTQLLVPVDPLSHVLQLVSGLHHARRSSSSLAMC
jgi:hypothetical protein